MGAEKGSRRPGVGAGGECTLHERKHTLKFFHFGELKQYAAHIYLLMITPENYNFDFWTSCFCNTSSQKL